MAMGQRSVCAACLIEWQTSSSSSSPDCKSGHEKLCYVSRALQVSIDNPESHSCCAVILKAQSSAIHSNTIKFFHRRHGKSWHSISRLSSHRSIKAMFLALRPALACMKCATQKLGTLRGLPACLPELDPGRTTSETFVTIDVFLCVRQHRAALVGTGTLEDFPSFVL